jgi:hypothetical protein
MLHLLQPVVRLWGRLRHREPARREIVAELAQLGPATSERGGVLLVPADRPRPELAAAIVNELRRSHVRVLPPTEWEDHDAAFVASTLMLGELVTSGHPEGCVQLRVRRRLRALPAILYAVTAAMAALLTPLAGAAVLAVALEEVGRGAWRCGPRVRRVVRRAGTS